ncbi:MAG: chitinase [Verrucomicrobiota bacterium]
MLANLLAGTGAVARAEWPARIFAPYMYAGTGDHFKLTDCDDACGQKFYTLAFIIADKSNNPAWFGQIPMERHFYAEQIAAIRARGGDVIISFGGEGGTEIALVETNVDALAAKYQSVIDPYHFTWLDFDIEGDALTKHRDASERRNAAIATLQQRHPGLRISYTLPVDPDGISGASRKLLANARTIGVKVYSVNVMVMDFGSRFSQGKKMSDVSIASAMKAHEQCVKIDSAIGIGLTPDLGQNDVKSEIFSLDDAGALEAWGAAQPWVCSVSFWDSNRDSADHSGRHGDTSSGVEQKPWAFTRIFQRFALGK